MFCPYFSPTDKHPKMPNTVLLNYLLPCFQGKFLSHTGKVHILSSTTDCTSTNKTQQQIRLQTCRPLGEAETVCMVNFGTSRSLAGNHLSSISAAETLILSFFGHNHLALLLAMASPLQLPTLIIRGRVVLLAEMLIVSSMKITRVCWKDFLSKTDFMFWSFTPLAFSFNHEPKKWILHLKILCASTNYTSAVQQYMRVVFHLFHSPHLWPDAQEAAAVWCSTFADCFSVSQTL